jgi:hypothetical protein
MKLYIAVLDEFPDFMSITPNVLKFAKLWKPNV